VTIPESRPHACPLHEPSRLAGPSRRAVLLGTPGAVVLTALAAGQAHAATKDTWTIQAFNGLASYVLPGDDAYSRQQRRTRPGPGGVAAGTAAHLEACYQHAFAAAVNTRYGVNLPAAELVAAVIDSFTQARFLLQSAGPYVHPFANLTWARKGEVLAAIDEEQFLRRLPIGFGFNTILTLTGLGCYSEYGVFDQRTRQLTGTPVGWKLANHAGVRDGWPELTGYWGGVRQVPDVPDEPVAAASAPASGKGA